MGGLRQAALDYALRGWFVLPCERGGKAPLGRLVRRGFLDASRNPAQIETWWRDNPDANIGLSLAMSGLVCLDIDSYKAGCTWLRFVAEYGIAEELDGTLRQKTARGGTHYIFRAPNGAAFAGTLRHKDGSKVVGVDVKHHGYILVEPSVLSEDRW